MFWKDFLQIYLKGAWYMEGAPLQSVTIPPPPNEYRWIQIEQQVSPNLDFKASSPLTPSAGKCIADHAFSSEIFSEETESNNCPRHSERLCRLDYVQLTSGTLPSHLKHQGPDAADFVGITGLLCCTGPITCLIMLPALSLVLWHQSQGKSFLSCLWL